MMHHQHLIHHSDQACCCTHDGGAAAAPCRIAAQKQAYCPAGCNLLGASLFVMAKMASAQAAACSQNGLDAFRTGYRGPLLGLCAAGAAAATTITAASSREIPSC
jgi:hypothetical protein